MADRDTTRVASKNFTFNGKSTADLGLVVQTPPSYVFPDRDISSIHIPGRNGDLYIDNRNYKNVERSYLIGKDFNIDNSTYVSSSEDILEWLTSAQGKYAKLTDEYDPGVYRMAMFNMNGDFSNIFDGALSFNVTFQCKPQRFLNSGDIPVSYEGSIAIIDNDTGYTSLPIISVSGIDAELEKVLMMTVKNNSQDIISSITISKFNGSEIIIDSDNQTVLDENQNDVSIYVGLNGKPFPSLEAGESTIKLEKFESESGEINSYNYIISQNQTIVKSEYKPYDSLIIQNRKKYLIKSYASLIENKQEVYEAESVQSFLSSKASEYVFKSYNDILSQFGKSYSFTGNKSENINSCPDWIEIVQTQDGDPITLKVPSGKIGFYFVKNIDKNIKFHSGLTGSTSDIIAQGISPYSIINVYFYEAVEVPTTISSTGYGLEPYYTDMPEWLYFNIKYDDNGNPYEIGYYTNATGYYWTDKTWIFGKAQWNKYETTSSDPSTRVVLNTLSWNTTKAAFVSTSGLTTSTTATFTYKYIALINGELPQYDPITAESENGSTPIILAPVRFKITDLGTTLENIKVSTNTNGYYSYGINKANIISWDYKSNNVDFISSLKGTDSFIIYFMEANDADDVPTYEGIEDWPEWLDPIPVKTGGTQMDPVNISFVVLKDAWYCYSETIEDKSYSQWVYLLNGQTISMAKGKESSYNICELDEKPSTYAHDRAYNDSSTIPSWLNVEYITDDITGEQRIRYSVAQAGYFKWDSNVAWSYKSTGELLITGYEDNTTFYYMSELPEYDEYALSDLILITPSADVGGNPNKTVFTIKEGQSGYYRVNNNANWTYYQEGEEILTSKVGESNMIYHLNPTEDELDDMSIRIIPRWWTL